MTFAEIRHEIDALPTDEQDRLAAYLALRQNERDEEWCAKIAERLHTSTDEKTSWIPLEQVEFEMASPSCHKSIVEERRRILDSGTARLYTVDEMEKKLRERKNPFTTK